MSRIFNFILIVFYSYVFQISAANSEETKAIQVAADRLAKTVRKLGFERIAVLPFIFIGDVRDQQIANRDSFEPSDRLPSTQLRLSVTNESELWSEEMQRALGTASSGDFRIVSREELLNRITSAGEKVQDLSPVGDRLLSLVNPNGDIRGLIVGIKKLAFDQKISELSGDVVLGVERHDLQWNLIDLSDKTIRDTPEPEKRTLSLAEDVYRGRSIEFFRYRGETLQTLLPFNSDEINKVPLRPSDAFELYNHHRAVSSNNIHPVYNRNCPFQVGVEVNGKALPITVPIRSTSQLIVGRGLTEIDEFLPHAFVSLESGDKPTIKVKNRTSKRVMVAVFVDGVNCRGKQRELPDENCKAWVVDAEETGVFNGWYDGQASEKVLKEPFVVTDWQNSIAGRMGLEADAKESRSITVVFFSDGWPDKKKLQVIPGHLKKNASLSANRSVIDVKEVLEPINGAARVPDALGIGAGRPVPENLNVIKGVSPGSILAAMTFWYAPKSDLDEMIKRRIQREMSAQGGDDSGVKFVTIFTSK